MTDNSRVVSRHIAVTYRVHVFAICTDDQAKDAVESAENALARFPAAAALEQAIYKGVEGAHIGTSSILVEADRD